VEKLIINANGPYINYEHLPADITGAEADSSGALTFPPLEENNRDHHKEVMTDFLIERQAIIDSLARHNGNISKVAKELGFSRNTIYRKLNFYKIAREQSFE